jgi:hypothetical protein
MIPVMSPKRAREGLRTRAHRTILTAAVNAGLTQRIIGRGDGENYWPGAPEAKEHVFRFELPGGIPAAAYIHDLGGELALHVALWPSSDLKWLAASNAGYVAGEAFVVGWLERKEGFWLQDRFCNACIRTARVLGLAQLEVKPAGYGIGAFVQ